MSRNVVAHIKGIESKKRMSLWSMRCEINNFLIKVIFKLYIYFLNYNFNGKLFYYKEGNCIYCHKNNCYFAPSVIIKM